MSSLAINNIQYLAILRNKIAIVMLNLVIIKSYVIIKMNFVNGYVFSLMMI